MKPLIIAHRGASWEYPDNTLPAFEAAINYKADLIELDIHLTKDGVPVCQHCGTFHHRRGKFRLADYTLEEMKELRAESRHPPTLEQVLQLKRGRTGLMIELKAGHHDPNHLADQVLKLLKKYPQGNLGRIWIGSFSLEILEYVNQSWPLASTVGIVETPSKLALHLSRKPACLALDVRLAKRACIEDIKAEGVEPWVWTVNQSNVAKRLISYGVTGIITDDPATMRLITH